MNAASNAVAGAATGDKRTFVVAESGVSPSMAETVVRARDERDAASQKYCVGIKQGNRVQYEKEFRKACLHYVAVWAQAVAQKAQAACPDKTFIIGWKEFEDLSNVMDDSHWRLIESASSLDMYSVEFVKRLNNEWPLDRQHSMVQCIRQIFKWQQVVLEAQKSPSVSDAMDVECLAFARQKLVIGQHFAVDVLGFSGLLDDDEHSGHGTQAPSKFYCRKDTLELLDALDAALNKRGIRVSGPPGVGKSTAAWFWACRKALVDGKTVVWLHLSTLNQSRLLYMSLGGLVDLSDKQFRRVRDCEDGWITDPIRS